MKLCEFLVRALFALFCLVTTTSAACYSVPDPMNPTKIVPTDCPQKSPRNDTTSYLQSQAAPQGNMFDINLSCDEPRCPQVKEAFETAGAILSKTFNFKTRIVVEASFLDFCKTGAVSEDICARAGGAAAPAQFVEVTDTDCVQRLYPQALYKQFNLQETHQFDSADITAMFNSVFDYHFPGDKNITPDQADFTYIVLHEMIHGLGFVSFWRTYFDNDDTVATPMPMANNVEGGVQLQFVESAFDQYMFDVNGKNNIRYTTITNKLNEFPVQDVTTETELYNNFANSDQGKIAKQVLQLFITPNSTIFRNKVGGNNDVVLETSLNPYQPSSSVSHTDLRTYENTPDFLMGFTAAPGETLEQTEQRVGAKGPIGPLTIALMSTLGYATDDNPQPYQPDDSKCNGTTKGNTGVTSNPVTSDGGSRGSGSNSGTGASDAKNSSVKSNIVVRSSLFGTLLLFVFLALM